MLLDLHGVLEILTSATWQNGVIAVACVLIASVWTTGLLGLLFFCLPVQFLPFPGMWSRHPHFNFGATWASVAAAGRTLRQLFHPTIFASAASGDTIATRPEPGYYYVYLLRDYRGIPAGTRFLPSDPSALGRLLAALREDGLDLDVDILTDYLDVNVPGWRRRKPREAEIVEVGWAVKQGVKIYNARFIATYHGVAERTPIDSLPTSTLLGVLNALRSEAMMTNTALLERHLDTYRPGWRSHGWREQNGPAWSAGRGDRSPFDVLGVTSEASLSDIAVAFTKLTRSLGKSPDSEQHQRLVEAFLEAKRLHGKVQKPSLPSGQVRSILARRYG
jgi:hypothetical protein